MKSKKGKKKGGGSSPLFITFPTSNSNFPPFLLQFSFFSSQFSPLFPFFPIRQQNFPVRSLWGHPFSLFSQYVSKNFPVRSLWGALCPPTCYATGLGLRQVWKKSKQVNKFLQKKKKKEGMEKNWGPRDRTWDRTHASQESIAAHHGCCFDKLTFLWLYI